MRKYKIGDRVIVKCSNIDYRYGSHEGKVGTIIDIKGTNYPYLVQIDNDSRLWCEVKCLVGESEEKKVFTKSDLKNGDVIVRRNGDVEIVIVDKDVLISKGGWNRLKDVNDDLTDESGIFGDNGWDIMKVYRPTENWHCQFEASCHGELVYDRERDTKKLYNGKVVCVDLNGCNQNNYTVGKIYEFKDGQMTSDSGYVFGEHEKFYTFKDWENYSSSKWIEIKE